MVPLRVQRPFSEDFMRGTRSSVCSNEVPTGNALLVYLYIEQNVRKQILSKAKQGFSFPGCLELVRFREQERM